MYRWCREGTGGSRQGPVRTQDWTCTGGVGRGREGAGRVLSEHRTGRVQVV